MESNLYKDEYIDFQKYWLVLKRRWLPATITFISVFALSFHIASSEEKVYEAKAQLLIERDKSAKLTGLEHEIGNIEVFAKDSDPLATEAAILRSRPIVEKTIKELDLRDEAGKLLKHGAVTGKLETKPLAGTDVLEIIYENPDRKLAAAVVNKLIAIYMEDDTISNRAEAAAARQFITEQLPEVERNVRQAETDLRIFKNQNQIANLEQETSAQIQTIRSLENQIGEIKADLNSIDVRYSQLQNRLGMSLEEASAISALGESVAVQRVLEELQNIKVNIAEGHNIFSENAPQMISWREREAELQNLLEKQIQQTLGSKSTVVLSKINVLSLGKLKQDQITELASLGLQQEGLMTTYASLQNNLANHKQRLAKLPSLEKQQNELDRKVQAAHSTYQNLLGKLQEIRVAENQNVGNLRVIADAVVPDRPVPPKAKLIMAGGVVAGALLGVAVAFLLDLQDQTIKHSKEAEELLGYPLQGIIPNFNKIKKNHLLKGVGDLKASQLTNNGIKLSPVVEACQILQANLALCKTQKSQKIIIVTSTLEKEGKSYVSANLAIAQSQINKRIVLVDADMRRPRQHEIWNISNDIGLSSILSGEVPWQQSIQGVMSGLDVLPAGKIPANPVGLIDSEAMKTLIANLETRYDQIIFDTPPLTGLADTRILGKLVDGLLLVVRPGVSDYSSTIATKKLLVSTELNVLGIVANAVDIGKEPKEYSS